MRKGKVETLYCFIAEDYGPNDEEIAAVQVGDLMMPLVGADLERVQQLRPLALRMAHMMGKTIRLMQFTEKKELEVIQPIERRKTPRRDYGAGV